MVTEEQNNFEIDIDRIKGFLSQPDRKFVNKLKHTVRKISIFDKFKINSQLNENQKEKFFSKQTNIKKYMKQCNNVVSKKKFSYNQDQIQ